MREITLEERREILVEILRYIDKLCKQNDLVYYLGYGTLLGAVRHGGFIPWDDDVDIWVPAKSLDTLIMIINKDNKYAVIDNRLDPFWQHPFSKVYDKRTIIKNNFDLPWNSERLTQRGIAVDLFPLVEVDTSTYKKVQHILYKRSQFFTNNMGYFTGLKKFYCDFFEFFGYGERFWREKLNSFMLKERNTGYVGCPVSPYPEKEFYKKEWFGVKQMGFQGYEFIVPEGYDNVLTKLYDDYMIPRQPKDSKTTHNVTAYWK